MWRHGGGMMGGRGAAAAMLGVVVAVMLAMLPGPAAAQGQFQPVVGTGEVTLSARWFGVGGAVRPGEWVGIQLQISDIGDRQRDVLVRITMADPDRDRILYERTLTTNPGITQPLWMYVRLPYRFTQADALNVTAFAAVEQAGPGAAGEGRWTYAAGRVLGTARISPNRPVIPSTVGAIGIVGTRPMGLTRYAGPTNVTMEYLPAGHERSEIIQRLDPETLPDRWFGLSQFDALIWNEPSPTGLGTERGQALREWVMRGGHLVVVLPRLGQAWTDEVNNPVYDIVPPVAVRRIEGVDLTPYRLLITKRGDMLMPRNQILHAFTPLEGAGPQEAICILAGPRGEADTEQPCIAVRRIVGTGMVTLVGLDVASQWMTDHGLPDAELFWHRVLGRRGELVTGREVDINNPINLARDTITLDRDVSDEIAKTGRAAAGVLIGFVVFIAYWLVAGPIGYGLLRRKGAARHGWVAFVGAAALFTGIAWGGATAIKPQHIEATHLTFLEHVYGQPVQRTRSWVSILVPEYGEAAISLGDPAVRGATRFQNMIAPWEPDAPSRAGFPDARDYRIESRSPDQVVVPVRATVKQFRMDWAGGPRWSMPRPVGAADGPEPRVRLTKRGNEWRIEGTLMHELPETMKNVTVVLVATQKNHAGSLHVPGMRPLLSHVFSVTLPEWPANTHLDLANVFKDLAPQAPRNASYGEKFFEDLLDDAGRHDSAEGLELDSMRAVKRMNALAFYSQIAPPDTRIEGRLSRSQRLALRKSSHGWDLGAWFTQPSLIIVGHVGDSGQPAPTATPIYVSMQGGVGGLTGAGQYREIPTYGRTVVRWVYPLGSAPPGGLELRTTEAGGEN